MLIRPVKFCAAALPHMRRDGRVDLVQRCGKRYRADRTYSARQKGWMIDNGWLIDDGFAPSRWREVRPDDGVVVVSITARPSWRKPSDDIDALGPALLTARFNGITESGAPGFNQWSPSKVLAARQQLNPADTIWRDLDYAGADF